MSRMYLDKGFQTAYKETSRYQLNDNIKYYVKDLHRRRLPDYVPTVEDVLWARSMTTGITEAWVSDSTLLQGLRCLFRDVGGIRSERRKWIHTILQTSVVLFTIDTTAYGKMLFRDYYDNKMTEQIAVFRAIINDAWFTRTKFILVFTKMDLIEEWLQREHPGKYFVNYPSRQNPLVGLVETYMRYLEGQFLSVVESQETAARIRILRGNLVDSSLDTVREVVGAINELTAAYPELNGIDKL
ncbi:guanine nucleotide binding protein, alpha subunit [Xylaria arbuscula]|nr:guanine nucleotide binding protein, alpha subunit [Xylaria arbuscula]